MFPNEIQKGVDLDRRGCEEDLGGVGEGKPYSVYIIWKIFQINEKIPWVLGLIKISSKDSPSWNNKTQLNGVSTMSSRGKER